MIRKDLSSNIWKACDIMRRDDGTTGIMEYVEQLSWMIFLKVFEDIEDRLESKEKLAGRQYNRILSGKYKWSSWTTKNWQGNDIIEFIDLKLFPFLRKL